MDVPLYNKRADALKHLGTHQILCNKSLTHYFVLDSYDDFQQLIQRDTDTNCQVNYYEVIHADSMFNLFLDIEIYHSKNEKEFNNHTTVISEILQTLKEFYTQLKCHFVVLESHSSIKKSYHIIARLQNNDGEFVVFNDHKQVKKTIQQLFPQLSQQKIVDTSVYRQGLFRTYLSSKNGENRPLIKSALSDPFDFLDTFVTYCKKPFIQFKAAATQTDVVATKPASTNAQLADSDHNIITGFVNSMYKQQGNIRDIFIDTDRIVIALNDTFCYNIRRKHKSNHQYIVIDQKESKQKCHDLDCADYYHLPVKVNEYPPDLQRVVQKCLKTDHLDKAIQDCKNYIVANFDNQTPDIQFDQNEMAFRGLASFSSTLASGKCAQCHLEHNITPSGYCIKCSVCNAIFPKNRVVPDNQYKHLKDFWVSVNNVVVNNGTLNIVTNNYYSNAEEEFSCDIQLDNAIFHNPDLTNMYNQILDGHKIVMISELLSKLEVDFKYNNGHWYFFNGKVWTEDKESLELRKRVIKLSNQFNRIQNYYEHNNTVTNVSHGLIKNVKSLINKLHKTSFESEVITGAKMYYNDESFFKKLNSKKHLVPFSNGVYDLLQNHFRTTTKDDYINFTLGYEYKQNVRNPEVQKFINQVLPNEGVRNYVLKKMSECLNGDIPNTNFLMFIGDGANGKSQLLNLMKLAMGDFGEKVEVTLLTRKRNNANEANTEKVKLMNKRFAFLSEPEDGEKINIGLLKELTSSEEIVARGLYQEPLSFVMEAKLFLACNELPEIKGEDSALWRRIRVVDFPSRFVDEPKDADEYPIDRTLPSQMREDVSWRQTFTNILLEFYTKNITEPEEVRMKTNEYREENNAMSAWVVEHIEHSPGSHISIKDVCMMYYNKSNIGNKDKGKLRKEVEKTLKEKYPNAPFESQRTTIDRNAFYGWLDFKFRENEM